MISLKFPDLKVQYLYNIYIKYVRLQTHLTFLNPKVLEALFIYGLDFD